MTDQVIILKTKRSIDHYIKKTMYIIGIEQTKA